MGFSVKTMIAFCAATTLLGVPMICRAAPAEAVKRGDISLLQTPNGFTLYTYSKDPPNAGKSTCDKQCAEAWPPFIAVKGQKAVAPWTIIARDDGEPQWAYKGRPLYRFFKDTQPGEMHGQNYNGHAWQIASP